MVTLESRTPRPALAKAIEFGVATGSSTRRFTGKPICDEVLWRQHRCAVNCFLHAFTKEQDMSQIPFVAVAILVFASATSVAQEAGNARSGRMLAEMTCAQCHAVGTGPLRSRNHQAPTFVALANTPGINAMNIRVALRTAHREMPNLSLTMEQVEDVATYILSLKYH